MSDAGCPLPQNLLFDLDGTLLDSLPGIRFSAEAAFRACGLEVGKTELRSLIGPPIRKIMERMAVRQLSGEELDALERSFRWSYDTEGWRMTPHYEAAAESLRELKASGRRLFVVSNKPRHISVRILEAEGTLGSFDEVVTRDSRTPPYKDKGEMVAIVLERWNLAASECLLVGDTMEDAEAASKSGMQFCLMTHGYGDVPAGVSVPVAFRLDHFSELVRAAAEEKAIDR
jgi:phosphoglycolate phosphatase